MRSFVPLAAVLALTIAGVAGSASARPVPHHHHRHKVVSAAATALSIDRVPLPGDGRGDYLMVDAPSGRLFVTHSKVVHILDLATLQPVATVTGLTAAHGVALDAAGHGYVSDGNSDSVIEFDPATGAQIARIAVGKKPDSILYDPASARIMAFDGQSEEISVIDPAKTAVVATIKLPHGPEYAQTDGQGHVYVNLEDGNSIAVIDSRTMALDHVIALTGCDGPAPLALDGANRRLFSGCGNHVMVVADADTGKIVSSVPVGDDPDGIVFDPGTHRVFVANRDGSWTIVDQLGADRYRVEQTLKIDTYAKTLAIDRATHRVFSSTADLEWLPAVAGKKHLPNAKPGTFRLLVVSQH